MHGIYVIAGITWWYKVHSIADIWIPGWVVATRKAPRGLKLSCLSEKLAENLQILVFLHRHESTIQWLRIEALDTHRPRRSHAYEMKELPCIQLHSSQLLLGCCKNHSKMSRNYCTKSEVQSSKLLIILSYGCFTARDKLVMKNSSRKPRHLRIVRVNVDNW